MENFRMPVDSYDVIAGLQPQTCPAQLQNLQHTTWHPKYHLETGGCTSRWSRAGVSPQVPSNVVLELLLEASVNVYSASVKRNLTIYFRLTYFQNVYFVLIGD